MKTIKKHYFKILLFLCVIFLIIVMYSMNGNAASINKEIIFNDIYSFNIINNQPFTFSVPDYFKIVDFNNIRNASIEKKYYSPNQFFIKLNPHKEGTYSIYFLNTLNNHVIKYIFNISKSNILQDKNVEIESLIKSLENLFKLKYDQKSVSKNSSNSQNSSNFKGEINNDEYTNTLSKLLVLLLKRCNKVLYNFTEDTINENNKNSLSNRKDANNTKSTDSTKNTNNTNNTNIINDIINVDNINMFYVDTTIKYIEDFLKYNYYHLYQLNKNGIISNDIFNLKNLSQNINEYQDTEIKKEFPSIILSNLIRNYSFKLNNLIDKENNINKANSESNSIYNDYFDKNFKELVKIKYLIYFLKGYKLFLNMDYDNCSKYFAISKESKDPLLKSLSYYFQGQNQYFLNNIDLAIFNFEYLVKYSYILKLQSILSLSKIYYNNKLYNNIMEIYNNELIENLFKNDKTLLEEIKKRIFTNLKTDNNIYKYSEKLVLFFSDYFYFYYGIAILKNNIHNYDLAKKVLIKIKNENFEYYDVVRNTLNYIKKNVEDY